jgi:hypothetical protein
VGLFVLAWVLQPILETTTPERYMELLKKAGFYTNSSYRQGKLVGFLPSSIQQKKS